MGSASKYTEIHAGETITTPIGPVILKKRYYKKGYGWIADCYSKSDARWVMEVLNSAYTPENELHSFKINGKDWSKLADEWRIQKSGELYPLFKGFRQPFMEYLCRHAKQRRLNAIYDPSGGEVVISQPLHWWKPLPNGLKPISPTTIAEIIRDAMQEFSIDYNKEKFGHLEPLPPSLGDCIRGVACRVNYLKKKGGFDTIQVGDPVTTQPWDRLPWMSAGRLSKYKSIQSHCMHNEAKLLDVLLGFCKADNRLLAKRDHFMRIKSTNRYYFNQDSSF
eukprot:TRINITY_DN59705_c0_g1_i1.p1 TRINITY_DN59705_c0_g1~~TRINITY_DN59705_c0_g1_i1.p1  ORF type:complete len:278 (-),score=12.31 TRINITY_DN59705_c0_g1_i1:405-1238(-)